jgi:hypothetical protein
MVSRQLQNSSISPRIFSGGADGPTPLAGGGGQGNTNACIIFVTIPLERLRILEDSIRLGTVKINGNL